jgi:hypothetical protein
MIHRTWPHIRVSSRRPRHAQEHRPRPSSISPVWLEKPERIAALAMLTVVGLLVYAVIQRQVRLSLREHDQQVSGNQGPTSTPTAAVVFTLFAPVILVQFAVDEQCSLQMHGVQVHQQMVCEAVGIDRDWYQIAATGQNSLPRTHTPLNVGSTALRTAHRLAVLISDAWIDLEELARASGVRFAPEPRTPRNRASPRCCR